MLSAKLGILEEYRGLGIAAVLLAGFMSSAPRLPLAAWMAGWPLRSSCWEMSWEVSSWKEISGSREVITTSDPDR